MFRSEEAWAAFRALRSAVKNPAKNKRNPHFKNEYADLGEVLDCVLDHVDENGFELIQHVDMDPETQTARLVTTLIHTKTNEALESHYPLLAEKGGPQGLGAALTYARRYSLKTMFNMRDVDDDGERAYGRGPESSAVNRVRDKFQPNGDPGKKGLKDALAEIRAAKDVDQLDVVAGRISSYPLTAGELKQVKEAGRAKRMEMTQS